MFIPMIILGCLDGPFCGHARSHKVTTNFATCTVPVGAGMPAKGPAQATSKKALKRHLHSQRVALNNPNSGINRLRAYRPGHPGERIAEAWRLVDQFRLDKQVPGVARRERTVQSLTTLSSGYAFHTRLPAPRGGVRASS
ncbi:hypothetical protein FYM84_02550 [Pseudomonas sp. CAH-1]|nr:hypothetical protein [Pseudomonas sp. CAH-1]